MSQDTRPEDALDTNERLRRVEAQLEQITLQLAVLVEAQRPMAELKEELGPIATAMLATGVQEFQHLEERGYFAFAAELKYLLERIAEDYHPADLHALADNIANILDTVKMATQPSVLAVLRDALRAFEEDRNPPPMGALSLFRRVRQEADLGRGVGFALDVLARVGRGVSRAPRYSRSSAETGRPTAVAAVRESPPRRTAAPAPPPPSCEVVPPHDFELIPDEAWTPEYATQLAHSLGVPELSEEHWALVRFARSDFSKNGAAPNIRRITTQTAVSTRRVYDLFPCAPGLTIARIAGIPRPKGCL